MYILGTDGCGKTEVIDGLIPLLRSSAVVVEKINPRSGLPFASEPSVSAASSDSCERIPAGSPISMAGLAVWLMDAWLNQFLGKRNLTLRIGESCCHHLLVDPRKYGYGVRRGLRDLLASYSHRLIFGFCWTLRRKACNRGVVRLSPWKHKGNLKHTVPL